MRIGSTCRARPPSRCVRQRSTSATAGREPRDRHAIAHRLVIALAIALAMALPTATTAAPGPTFALSAAMDAVASATHSGDVVDRRAPLSGVIDLGAVHARSGSHWDRALLVASLLGPDAEVRYAVGALGGSGPSTELVSLRIDLAAHAPDRPALTSTRVLLDRSQPVARSAGALSADGLATLPTDGRPSALTALHHVLVSTGAASPRGHALERAFTADFIGSTLLDEEAAGEVTLQGILFALALVDRALGLVSERLIVPGLAAVGSRAFIGAPRIYLMSLDFDAEREVWSRTIDLVLDDVDVVTPNGAVRDAAARHRLWYGVVMSALETEAVILQLRGMDEEGAQVVSASTRMPGARLQLLQPTDAGAARLAGPALSRALVPGHVAVTVDGSDVF